MHMEDSAFKATRRKTIKYFMRVIKAEPGLWSLLGGKAAGQRTNRDRGTKGYLGLDLGKQSVSRSMAGDGFSSELWL